MPRRRVHFDPKRAEEPLAKKGKVHKKTTSTKEKRLKPMQGEVPGTHI